MNTAQLINQVLQLDANSGNALVTFLKKAGIGDFEELGRRLKEQPDHVRKEFSPNYRIETWNEFGRYKEVEFTSIGSKALYWFATICSAEPLLLASHEKIRDGVEQNFMRGQVEATHQLLDQHELEFGKSLWSHQWRVLAFSASASEVQLAEYQQAMLNEAEGSLAVPILNLRSYLTRTDTPPRILRRSLRRSLEAINMEPIGDMLGLLLLDELPQEMEIGRINSLLECLEDLPLVDRYGAFIQLATHLLTADRTWERDVTRALQILAIDGNDARIILEKHHCGRVKSRLNSDAFESIQCWDYYFTGDYTKIPIEVAKFQSDAPYDFNLLDLKVKADLYQNSEEQVDDSPENWLAQTLAKVLRDNNIGDRVYDELDRFSLRAGFFSLGSQIRAFIRSYSGQGTSPRLVRLANLRGYHFSPRHNESITNIVPWRNYLALLIERKPDSCSAQFLYTLATAQSYKVFVGLGDEHPVAEIRRKYFKGLIALKLGFLPTALTSITSFIEECKDDPVHGTVRFALDQALILRAEVFRLMGDSESAQALLVDLQINGASALKRLNLTQFYELSYSNRKELSQSIDFPILAWLARVGPHENCLAIKRFLKHWGVALPSEFLKLALPFSSERVREFVFRVCTAENLDSISALDTNDKVDEERLRLLRWVTENYPEYAKQVEREKLNLIQVSQLRAGLNRIDDNKLVLDLASLQDVEGEQIEEIHQDYVSRKELALAAFAETIQKVFSEVSASGEGKTIVVSQDALLQAYNDAYLSAFNRLRKIFIRSPQFGFEACLSGRIRHGIVVEHLLKPLKAHALLVSERVSDQVKSTSFFEFDSLASLEPQQQEVALEALEKLTSNVADEARRFRDEVVQTDLKEGDASAVFNYFFKDQWLLEHHDFEDSEGVDWKSFSFEVFSVLAERTRDCLPVLRERISAEIKPSLLNYFDVCVKDIEAIDGVQPLRTRILQAKQELESACDDMLRWFQDLTGAIGQDVEFSFALNTAVGMLERLHPELQGIYSKEVAAGMRLKGRFFTSFVHVIFYLIENGIKHTDVDADAFRGRIELTNLDGELQLRVFSRMSSSESVERATSVINRRIREINLDKDPDSAIKEKGSGFAKILAALRYEFKAGTHNLEAVSDGEDVVVKITMMISGIAE
ncbi:hypothetical protein ACFQY0_20610 [Haloferula chungangensis]|uniref:ATP-binding protein n=1 Tax=Haloferula chungangensis TaxID=1048331 RepID=A0ABW2LE25_9BACT